MSALSPMTEHCTWMITIAAKKIRKYVAKERKKFDANFNKLSSVLRVGHGQYSTRWGWFLIWTCESPQLQWLALKF